MKRILTAAALLLVVAACNKDENYNDKYGDRAVIPPKAQSLRVMTLQHLRRPRHEPRECGPTWTRSPR